MPEWTRQHEQHRQRILELLAERARPFEDCGPEARAARRCRPLLEWCRTYLPHYFDRPFAPFHRRMVRAVGEPGMPTFVGAFRGAGKSVLLTLARPLRQALQGECPYFIYGSRVRKLAAQNMDYLRLELEHNRRLHADYGDLSTSGAQDSWTLEPPEDGEGEGEDFPVTEPVKFEAFGIGMSPRGRRYGRHRPLEFVGDDLEDAELARNPRREQQLWDWLMDEVLPALEPERFVFTVLGTMFGPRCMLERASELSGKQDSEGRSLARVFLQPAVVEGESVWPERFSDEALSRIRSTIGLRNWLRNYALSPDDPGRPFQPDWFATYREEEQEGPLHERLDVVCFLDPALSEASDGCPRALVAVGCERRTGVRYVLDAWIQRGSPRDMIDRIFEFHERYDPRLIGIESNGGYALIQPLLKMESRNRGRHLPVRYVNHSRSKEVRIERLISQMESGRWRFPANPPAGVKTLQEQFLNYPEGFVDGPDACAGCDELLPDSFEPGGDDFRYRSLNGRTDFSCV